VRWVTHLSDDLDHELVLARGVRVAVRGMAPLQIALESGVARGLLRMAAQVLAERERGARVLRRADVDVMVGAGLTGACP
jgi:hypothetical protein